MFGGTIVIALAAEIAPHFDLIEPCVAEMISFCPASDRVLDRTLDHTPEKQTTRSAVKSAAGSRAVPSIRWSRVRARIRSGSSRLASSTSDASLCMSASRPRHVALPATGFRGEGGQAPIVCDRHLSVGSGHRCSS